jgi:hypothetical protein
MRSRGKDALGQMAMSRPSLAKRLQKLDAMRVVFSYRCVCAYDIDQAAKTKMRPSDLGNLWEAMARSPEDFTPVHQTVWNRWNAARAEATSEKGAGAIFVLVLNADDCRL